MSAPTPSRLSPALIERIVELLVSAGLARGPALTELFAGPLRPIAHHVDDRLAPQARLRAALRLLGDLPAGSNDPLVGALRQARSHIAEHRAERSALGSIVSGLDAGSGSGFGLDSTHHGCPIRSVELTVRLRTVRHGGAARLAVDYWMDGRRLPLADRLLKARPTADPPALYRALFPTTPEGPTDPLRVVRGRSLANHAVRLRVVTADPELGALPWWAMTDAGGPVIGGPAPWTVELSPTEQPSARARLATVPRVIALTDDPLRFTSLREALHMQSRDLRFDNRVVEVRRVSDLPRRLDVRRHPVLMAFEPPPATLDALAATLAAAPEGHEPAVICLVGPRPPGWRPAPLLTRAAAVVWAPDGPTAHRWLFALLVDGLDPVTAAHRVLDGAALPVYTAFATWTAAPISRDEPPPAALVLDRIHQRNAAAERVKALASRRSPHRVEVLVALGPPGNRLVDLGEQIDEHIADKHGALDLDRRAVVFRRPPLPELRTYPKDKAERLGWLWRDLRAALYQPDGASPRAMLRALDGERSPGVERVVWLEWGALGQGPDHPPPTAFELRCWLRWHEALAGVEWPSTLRVASFLAIEGAPALLDKVEAAIGEMSLTSRVNAVRYTPLPRVKDRVPPDELRAYLNDPALSGVRDLAQPLAAALYRHTGGAFAALVEQLNRLRLIGAPALLDALRSDDDPEDDW